MGHWLEMELYIYASLIKDAVKRYGTMQLVSLLSQHHQFKWIARQNMVPWLEVLEPYVYVFPIKVTVRRYGTMQLVTLWSQWLTSCQREKLMTNYRSFTQFSSRRNQISTT